MVHTMRVNIYNIKTYTMYDGYNLEIQINPLVSLLTLFAHVHHWLIKVFELGVVSRKMPIKMPFYNFLFIYI